MGKGSYIIGNGEQEMQEHLDDFWKLLVEYWFLPATILTTFLMAVFRTAKVYGKIDWIESMMCALFAYGIWFALSWLNIPEGDTGG